MWRFCSEEWLGGLGFVTASPEGVHSRWSPCEVLEIRSIIRFK